MAETLDRAALAEAHRLLDKALATDCPWYEHANASARLSTWLTERAGPLLALAERVAAIDPALLDRLAERYAADDQPGPCEECGAALVKTPEAPIWRDQRWTCPAGHPGGTRYTEAGDRDVMRLLAAIRGEAVPDDL